MTGEPENRRKQERRLLTYFSRVIDNKNGRLLGYLVDMTTNGAMIVGNVPLKVNDDFNLRIDLPENIADKQQLIVSMKVVWTKPDPDPELYRTGLKFIHVADDDLAVMKKVIAEFSLDKLI